MEEWIRRGIPFPAAEPAARPSRRTIDLVEGRKHWAFQPLHEHEPAEMDPWCSTKIDRFIRSAQRTRGLSPSPPATRSVLLRRAKFDLLGLPPSPDEIEAFAGDNDPKSYERLVDRYLASPHYGERWGRFWLDLVRYCDVGESWREGEGRPWLYRDWVVAALNQDLPYNEFVRRQLAADLLPEANPADNAALGFLGLSPNYWKELKLDHWVIKQVVAEEWEERIEAVSGTFLGLTVACARCHDHKFDPVTNQDYYALAGVLSSTRLEDRAIIPAGGANSAALPLRKAARAATTITGDSPCGWPAAACAAAWPTAPPTTLAFAPWPTRSTFTTCTPRCCTCWDWITSASPTATPAATIG